jgi:hypothetical protein
MFHGDAVQIASSIYSIQALGDFNTTAIDN